MTTKDIVDRAVLLADLQNSGYITYEEKLASLNESRSITKCNPIIG